MRPWTSRALTLGAALLALSCTSEGPTGPELRRQPHLAPTIIGTGPAVRISEIHYDNTGTDTGESIELSGPAGTNLTGWSVVLYNGNVPTAAVTYNTRALTQTIPATCNQRGVIVLTYPTDGIQNGPNDGVALVDNTGAVVEFLAYEGPFTASNGPAAGMTSVNVGVSELGTTPIGQSLQRQPDGTWTGPAANSFGACNDGDENPGSTPVVASVEVTPALDTIDVGATLNLSATAFDAAHAPIAGAALTWSTTDAAVATVSTSGVVTGVSAGLANIIAAAENGFADTALVVVQVHQVELPPVRFSEIHYDNFGTDANEVIEVEGPAGASLAGWSIVLYNGNGGLAYDTKALTGTLADACSGRGTAFVSYPSNAIQNGSPDGMALVNDAGTVVEFLSYEGTFLATDGPAAGMTSTDIIAFQNSAPVGTSLQRTPAGAWTSATANPGYCYGVTPPPPPNGITFSGRDNTDPPLPVGFEDQLFATLRSGSDGTVITTTFTWASETPALASIDANGVVRALGAGTMVLRATASDGTSATYALESIVGAFGGTAAYGNNTEFGDPTDGDASDEVIIRRAQYTSSFSPARGIPNWVAYDLDASHFGALDRCDCFTYDPELPQGQRYTTGDYTGAGAIAGYGIDRGHLARSFDRTTGSLDNAATFYFSNIIPQASDNNQGPWAQFENHLGDLARNDNREVYIVAGASGSKGTVKNEGRITIPSATWKVALVLPRDAGLASIDSWDDVQVLAVLMPNDAGIRNVPWQTYLTTVDAVEAASGFDLLSALRDDIETAVESGTRPPVAALDGPWSGIQGDAIAMSGALSSDADGDALTYAWSFGDGTAGFGQGANHAYAAAGSYAVTLVVTDVRGLADTVTSTATVSPFTVEMGLTRSRQLVADLYVSGAITKTMWRTLGPVLDKAEAERVAGNLGGARNRVAEALEDVKVALRKQLIDPAAAATISAMLERTLAAF